MELKKTNDIFSLSSGDIVSKRNLFDLIQFSKVEGSSYWSDPDSVIGNTPQQGINWVGLFPEVRAVIIKTRLGSYEDDGWSSDAKIFYHYSFKARNGVISYQEKANAVLIKQPENLYPILLFTEKKNEWRFEGEFFVSEIEQKFVVLSRGNFYISEVGITRDKYQYNEGTRKYITHLLAERSNGVVKALKEANDWVCDLCGNDFHAKYGVKYIEAHHKVPMSTYSSNHKVRTSDLALLCPNCHKAVHIYMKKDGLEYDEIKDKLVNR